MMSVWLYKSSVQFYWIAQIVNSIIRNQLCSRYLFFGTVESCNMLPLHTKKDSGMHYCTTIFGIDRLIHWHFSSAVGLVFDR
jgi:hypothetical protein